MKRSTALTLGASVFASIAIPRFARAAAPLPIRVGAGPDEDFAEAFYAADMGFFKEAGLDPQITMMSNGGALTAAVVSGSLDVATTNTGSMAAAYARGIPLVLIAPEGIYSSTELTAALVVAKNSPIKTAKDLTGKKVAITTLHTLYHTSVQNWIDKNGGDSTSVQYLEIPLSAQLAALKAGRIDAAAMVEPWISHAKGDVTVLGKPYDSVADQFMISGWVTTKNWIHNNRPALEAFVATMRKTAEWANTNPKQTGPILSKYFKIPLSTIDAVPRTMMGITLDPKLIQPVIDMEYKYKLIPKTFAAAELFPEHTA